MKASDLKAIPEECSMAKHYIVVIEVMLNFNGEELNSSLKLRIRNNKVSGKV